MNAPAPMLRPAAQQPDYADPAALMRVEALLRAAPPLVRLAEIDALSAKLAAVAGAQAFLLQGGDCAESIEAGPMAALGIAGLLDEMAMRLAPHAPEARIVRVARAAGQFAKPRSTATETIGDAELPAYRGDLVNGAAFQARARKPDPRRMLAGWRAARATLGLLRRLADPPFTSHEALLLPYEQAQLRRAPDGRCYSSSAAMLWIGERTRDPDGAHVALAAGIANPIGIKCGPTMTPDALLRLIDRLDPDNRPGRLTLIGRFGAGEVERALPPLVAATKAAGRHAIWMIDPMHGNGQTAAGRKTRALPDILAETRAFFAIVQAAGVWPGGIHLELTADHVTECLGGSQPVGEADLKHRYWTYCDPRLNRAQALDLARAVAGMMRW